MRGSVRRMEAKDFLKEPSRIARRIESLKIKKAEFETLANSIPGGNYDQPVVQKSHDNKAPFVRWIDKILEVEKKIEEAEKELNKVKSEVLAAIEKIPNEDYQNLLIMRYLNECTWDEICDKLYISLSTVKRWHWDALKLINLNL